MEDVSALVARQYETFAYPEPFADLTQQIARGYYQLGDPALYGPILWPRGRRAGSLRILVAGCGTVQAAYTAHLNRGDEVVGIDLSEASLAHERFLQDRHDLSNMTLYRGDLLDVSSLGANFDVVLCTGVLHHMADPGAGLAALRTVLAPDGVMVLMVYGQTSRTGVYMLQDAFRRMRIGQTTEGVSQVRGILAELPARHSAQTYIRAAKELKHDSALVDTFLHPQDRAYTIPQLFELVEGAGLEFQNWVDNLPYWRNGEWGPDSATAAAVDPLPPREHWAAIEMLRQAAGMHIFTARQPHPGRSLEVDFDDPEWRDFIPHRAQGLVKTAQGQFQRGSYTLHCSPVEEFVLEGANGERTIAEIISAPALSELPSEQRNEFGRRYFEHLWKLGHMMIAMPSVPGE